PTAPAVLPLLHAVRSGHAAPPRTRIVPQASIVLTSIGESTNGSRPRSYNFLSTQVAELFAKLLQRAIHSDLHGADFAAEDAGDLLVSQILKAAEKEQFALFLRQVVKGLTEEKGILFLRKHFFGHRFRTPHLIQF